MQKTKAFSDSLKKVLFDLLSEIKMDYFARDKEYEVDIEKLTLYCKWLNNPEIIERIEAISSQNDLHQFLEFMKESLEKVSKYHISHTIHKNVSFLELGLSVGYSQSYSTCYMFWVASTENLYGQYIGDLDDWYLSEDMIEDFYLKKDSDLVDGQRLQAEFDYLMKI